MHVDAADEVTMTGEATGRAGPVATFGLVFAPALRTAAGRSPFRAVEARNAGLSAFVRQVVDVLTVLPLRHALIVMQSAAPAPDAIRVADVEIGDTVVPAEVDDLPRPLVA